MCVDPNSVVGEEHLASHSNGFLFSLGVQRRRAFVIEELGLSAESLFELLPVVARLGLGASGVLENQNSNTLSVHVGEQFFKLAPVQPIHVERYYFDVVVFPLAYLYTIEFNPGREV